MRVTQNLYTLSSKRRGMGGERRLLSKEGNWRKSVVRRNTNAHQKMGAIRTQQRFICQCGGQANPGKYAFPTQVPRLCVLPSQVVCPLHPVISCIGVLCYFLRKFFLRNISTKQQFAILSRRVKREHTFTSKLDSFFPPILTQKLLDHSAWVSSMGFIEKNQTHFQTPRRVQTLFVHEQNQSDFP